MGIDILTLAAARAGKGGGSASKYKQPDWGHEVSTGMIDVLPEMTFDYSREALVELFDTPFPEPLVVGKTYRVTWNGQTVDCVAYEATDEDGYIGLGRNTFSEGEEPFGIHVFNEVRYGKYYWQAEGHDGIYPVTVHIATEGEVRVVHKIPGEYVGGVGKYKQPEWGAETAIVDILPETAISVGETMEGVIEPRFYVVEGKKYIVNYNGIDYVCTARTVDGILVLGNVEFLIDAGDTGEPFAISPFNDKEAEEFGAGGVIYPIDGSTSVTLSIKGEVEIIHTIPAKYTGNTMRVTVSHDKTADKTYEEIETAIENGAIVQVFFDAVGNLSENGYTVYTLSQFVKGAGILFYNGGFRQILTIASDGTIDSGMAD